ncbi:hypothetical protein Ade02nite_00420 [Paractinoplanes deccanensis]|uniref:Pycsar effector protein domain-containing protein n=1 Tax=Paractinoplanes deccanensis TaxID=113561 RepID=A0ABQ3XUI1_9ACTN|nr:Pycsar system effector family protein [Actinoplanes deccanensis]GID71401.1 hypothetical protein Ade02nite_00420 [Actinoplanes deccanensis]
MSATSGDHALDYSRRLYANVVDWYKVAETKAQVILSLDGIFISFLIGSVLATSADARDAVKQFAWHTWIALALLAVSLAASVFSAVRCLITRVMTPTEARKRYTSEPGQDRPDGQMPESLWFFQSIAMFDETVYCESALGVDAEAEKAALNNQIYLLSGKVLKKHRWVNRGFFFAGAALIFFLAVGLSYLWQIS